ncbi:MAG: type II secretion system F family protein [Candidatus Margulisiibacteriota bacterium]
MSSTWFKCRYKDSQGTYHNERIKAKSIRLAKQYILSKNYQIINIRKIYPIENKIESLKKYKWYKIIFNPKLSRNEVYWLTKELYGFLESGLSLLDALHSLKGFSPKKSYQKALQMIIKDIENGKKLSDTLENFPSSFPRYYIIAIKSGESVGHLSQSLKSNAETINWVNINRMKILQATIFPIISLIMMISAFFISLNILVPYFVKVLEQMRVEPPYMTAKMFALHQYLGKHGQIIILLINAFLMLLALMASNKKTGYILERIIVKLPIYGQLYVFFISTYLSQILTLLISQRYSILNSFLLCQKLFNGPFFNREMEKIYEKVKRGYSLGQCFEESILFPSFMSKLIKDGEKTGTLEAKMKAISELYRIRLENKVEWVFKMISPTYLVFTIAVSIFFMYAFFWPVWDLYF